MPNQSVQQPSAVCCAAGSVRSPCLTGTLCLPILSASHARLCSLKAYSKVVLKRVYDNVALAVRQLLVEDVRLLNCPAQPSPA